MRNCEFCNEDLGENPRLNKRFCSRKCKNKSKRKRLGQTRWNSKKKRERVYKKDKCDHCGFVSIHECQLDLDHIDGNGKNEDSSNYQTLCANCHRLKTYINKDWEDKNIVKLIAV